MEAYQWLLNLVPRIANIWFWLNTNLIEIGELTFSPIEIISVPVISILLISAFVKG